MTKTNVIKPETLFELDAKTELKYYDIFKNMRGQMLKKIKQRTLEKAIDRLLNVSIGIMGVGGLGFFVGQEG